ncbi:MAG: macrocin O-methyltransferase [Chitinophagaceae bacterium]|nr:macrocin O-methyltransferase [Chitinophagaceae bacterium]
MNYPLGLLGWKIIRKRRLELVNLSDIEEDKKFLAIYRKVKDQTMVRIERCYTLYQSVQYIIKNKIEGDFVECGVWKGGSCMLMAYTLQEAGISNRKIYVYDTFEGMNEPTDADGQEAKDQWQKGIKAAHNTMCYASYDVVRSNIESTGYPVENMVMVKGPVEKTIPATIPSAISLLRLDTDWYESTKHELHHLYPLLARNGVLIVDDYGAWPGAQKATDEYFSTIPNTFLARIDYTGRIVIKK